MKTLVSPTKSWYTNIIQTWYILWSLPARIYDDVSFALNTSPYIGLNLDLHRTNIGWGGTQKTDIPYLHTGFEFWPTEMCQLSWDSSTSILGLATDLQWLSVNLWFMFRVYVLFQSDFWIINLSPYDHVRRSYLHTNKIVCL